MTTKITIDRPFTTGEVLDIETYIGGSIELISSREVSLVKTLIIIYTILRRRQESDWAVKDTLNLPLPEVMETLTLDDQTLITLGLSREIEVDEDPKSD